MSRSGARSVQVPGREWTLDGDKLVFHNLHVKAGVKRDRAGCGFCLNGVAQILAKVSREVSKDGVAEGDGVDEAGSTPPARGDDGSGEEKDKLPW